MDQWGNPQPAWETDGQTPVELARRADKDKPNVTRLLKILEDKGLVYRLPDPEDRRSQPHPPAEAGAAPCANPMLDVGNRLPATGLPGPSAQDVAQLKDLLNRLYANVS